MDNLSEMAEQVHKEWRIKEWQVNE